MSICCSNVFSTMRTVTEMLWLQHRQNDLEWMNLVPAGSPTMLSNHQTNVHALLQAKLERILLTYAASLKYPPPPANVWRHALGLVIGNRAWLITLLCHPKHKCSEKVHIYTYIYIYIKRERERDICIVFQSLSHV